MIARAVAVAAIACAFALAQETDVAGQARALIDAGRLEDAATLLGATPAGRDVRVEIARADLLLARKDAAGAVAAMERVIASLRPEGELLRAARRTLSRALVDAGREADAAPVILASYGLDGPSAAASLAVAARGFAALGDRAAARSVLGVALRVDPSRSDLLVVRASLALEDGDPRDALRDLDRHLRGVPTDVAARRLRAQALHAAGRAIEARDALAALDRVEPLSPPLLRILAALDLEAGLPGEAEAVLRRAGALSPSDVAAVAAAWIDAEEPARALALLSRHPNAPDAIRLVARAHLQAGDAAAAASALRSLSSPSRDDLLLLAEALRLSANPAEAVGLLAPLLSRDAADVAVRVALIQAQLDLADVATARRLLRDGLVLSPHPALDRLLDDLVPDLAPSAPPSIGAVLSGSAFLVGGLPATADSATLKRLRSLRGFGPPPTVHLLLSGPVDARGLSAALDLLSAAGLVRVRVDPGR